MDPGLPDCCQTVSFVCSFVWVAVSPFGKRKIRIPNRREIALFGDARQVPRYTPSHLKLCREYSEKKGMTKSKIR